MAAAPTARWKLVDLMRATLADQAANRCWVYKAIRPMPVPPMWHPGQRVDGDCSKGVQYLCRWAGFPDPMGLAYADWGNSSTLAVHLRHASYAIDLVEGDIVTFGSGGRDHAAMVLEPGLDPLLWSFGHQGAPNTYPLSADRRERQYLRLDGTVLPPADAKLRARTGYWAWVQWRLGEGDWNQHQAADKTIRPNVPKLIPAGWWKTYALFVAARKKGNEAKGPTL